MDVDSPVAVNIPLTDPETASITRMLAWSASFFVGT